jgi:hypothetical protein
MDEDQRAQMVFLMAALLLPIMGLMARRLPLGKTLQMALVWGAIFLFAFVLLKLIAPLLGFDLT